VVCSFVGLVWIYPIPCAVVNARSTVSNGPSAAVNGSTVANGSNGVNSSNIAINGPNTAVNGPRAIINGGPTVVNGQTTVKDPSTIANGLSTVVNDDSIAVKNSSTAASGPNNVISIAVPALQWPPITVPNIWLISSAKLTEDMINIKRTMLNNLASKNMRNASTSPPFPSYSVESLTQGYSLTPSSRFSRYRTREAETPRQ
jgi:hypothetical protein